jgi:hypothetical protein
MILAIDFDGVIHDFKHPIPGRRMGGPIDGAAEALTRFKQRGDEIVIFTVWGGTEQGRETIRKWLDYYQIPFSSITNEKVNADYYIDDKAITFTAWEHIKI